CVFLCAAGDIVPVHVCICVQQEILYQYAVCFCVQQEILYTHMCVSVCSRRYCTSTPCVSVCSRRYCTSTCVFLCAAGDIVPVHVCFCVQQEILYQYMCVSVCSRRYCTSTISPAAHRNTHVLVQYLLLHTETHMYWYSISCYTQKHTC